MLAAVWLIPVRPELKTDRAGIVPYQHSDLVAELVAESREALWWTSYVSDLFKIRKDEERVDHLGKTAMFA